MKKDARLDDIVKICERDGITTIGMLAEKMQVSEITIRRDLKLLESLKLIRKYKKGYAVADTKHAYDVSSYHIDRELQVHAEKKRDIGIKAASLIKKGETVIFDCGSTILHMVQALPERAPIRAVCYGLNVATALQKKQVQQLIVFGGVYHDEMDTFEGLSETDEIRYVRAQKAFLSAFGIHKQAGLTSGSFFMSSMRKKIISSSEVVVLLADSSKFGVIECAHFADLSTPHLYVTDRDISAEYREILENLNKTLIVV